MAFSQKLLFGRFRVDENHISVAAPAGVERLPRSLRDDFHGDARLLLKDREQILEQTAVLRRRCRSNHNRFFLRSRVSSRNKYGSRDRYERQYVPPRKHVVLLEKLSIQCLRELGKVSLRADSGVRPPSL